MLEFSFFHFIFFPAKLVFFLCWGFIFYTCEQYSRGFSLKPPLLLFLEGLGGRVKKTVRKAILPRSKGLWSTGRVEEKCRSESFRSKSGGQLQLSAFSCHRFSTISSHHPQTAKSLQMDFSRSLKEQNFYVLQAIPMIYRYRMLQAVEVLQII